MALRYISILVLAAAVLITGGAASGSKRPAQSAGQTLVGDWILSFSPINGQNFSRLGNTLGFADRDIAFDAQGGLQTAVVTREDLNTSLHPLGAWRVMGDQFSATFELWCEGATAPCGTVTLRGSFTDVGKVKGTATVFFEQDDSTTPTGLDTWTMAFRGNQAAGGAN